MTAVAAPGPAIGLPPIPRPEDRGFTARYRQVLYGGLVAAALYLLFFAWYTKSMDTGQWLGFFVGPILALATMPFLMRLLNKVEPDPRIRMVVMAGLVAKILGSYARYIAGGLVLGYQDSSVYHYYGSGLSVEFRAFVFGGPFFADSFRAGPGTNFIRLLTGVLFTFIGDSFSLGYLAFAFMSFWGLYLFYRAYSIANPDGLRLRYAMLVFFLPSMVFWPSSIGKEAWMTLTIGIGVYGMARLLAHRRFGYLLIALGMLGMGVVRPHVAAIFGVGLVSAFLLRRSGGKGGTIKKLLGLVVFAAAAGVLMSQLQSFFGLEQGLDPSQVFEETTRRTSQGGSQFESAQPNSPIELPWAIVTVLFRPFLFEAGNVAGLVSAVEGNFLLLLFGLNLSKLLRLPAQMIQRSFLSFAVLYTLVFVFAFSSINNFGILARQRTQLFPIAVVLLCTPSDRPMLVGRRKLVAAREGVVPLSVKAPIQVRSPSPAPDLSGAGPVRR